MTQQGFFPQTIQIYPYCLCMGKVVTGAKGMEKGAISLSLSPFISFQSTKPVTPSALTPPRVSSGSLLQVTFFLLFVS